MRARWRDIAKELYAMMFFSASFGRVLTLSLQHAVDAIDVASFTPVDYADTTLRHGCCHAADDT